jgi:hypothetical protein
LFDSIAIPRRKSFHPFRQDSDSILQLSLAGGRLQGLKRHLWSVIVSISVVRQAGKRRIVQEQARNQKNGSSSSFFRRPGLFQNMEEKSASVAGAVAVSVRTHIDHAAIDRLPERCRCFFCKHVIYDAISLSFSYFSQSFQFRHCNASAAVRYPFVSCYGITFSISSSMDLDRWDIS